MPTSVLADLVLLLHFGIVIFVVLGPPLIWLGYRRGWAWVGARGWRMAHLVAIAVVMLQAWAGRYCVLTDLESALRLAAGQPGYGASFVQHWVQRLLYHEAPLWMFGLAYTGFAVLVAWQWWRFPPRRWRPLIGPAALSVIVPSQPTERPLMAKPNYSFEKRQRELAKKRKKEEKAQRKAAPAQGPETPESGESAETAETTDAPPLAPVAPPAA